MIKSLEFDQSIVLRNILELIGAERFDADITYGNGAFYRGIPAPLLKFDIDPDLRHCITASSERLPLPSSSLRSVVFDPPFLTYIKSGRRHNSIMGARFSGYWRYSELESHYVNTLRESARVLKKGGVMVFKCQDIIHNHKMHATHINVVQWGAEWFRLKDMFILGARHRLPMPEKDGEKRRTQRHARVYHSYFLVLERIN